MKCPDCGYEIEKPNKKTCPCCGASLKAIKAQTVEEVKQPEPFVQDSFRSEPSRTETSPSAEPQRVCPSCQTPVPNGFNFCPSCGYDMREPADSDSAEMEILAVSFASQSVNQDSQNDEPVPVVEELEPEIKPGPRRYEPQYTPYSSESELDEPKPEHYQPDNNDDYEEEVGDNPEMGGFYPYPGEEAVGDTIDEPFPTASSSTSTSWLVIVIAAITSFFIGALLYFVVN